MSLNEKQTHEWIQVGELVDGFGGNELEPTAELVGKSVDIHFENGWIINHTFTSDSSLDWEVLEGSDKGQQDSDTYRATSLRENVFFVDFIKHSERAMSISLIMDLNRNICTAVIGNLPTEESTNRAVYTRVLEGQDLTPVETVFLHGTVNTPYRENADRHTETQDLVGKSVQYDYGDSDSYEHHYLNENLYTWHCVKGAETGLADTDKCHYYKIDSDLYLFVWREKIIPTLGVIMVDLKKLKTTGKLFGYKSFDFDELSNGPVGAHMTVLK